MAQCSGSGRQGSVWPLSIRVCLFETRSRERERRWKSRKLEERERELERSEGVGCALYRERERGVSEWKSKRLEYKRDKAADCIVYVRPQSY